MDDGLDLSGILSQVIRLHEPDCRFISTLCGTLAPVTRLCSFAPPAVLVLTSNWCIGAGEEVLAVFAALSPGTKYLILTGRSPPFERFHKVAEDLQISVALTCIPF